MANSIALASQFVPVLDEIYKLSSLTAKLDGNPDLVAAGANANELVIPKLTMQGLGNYSRNSGYVSGDVTLTKETGVEYANVYALGRTLNHSWKCWYGECDGRIGRTAAKLRFSIERTYSSRFRSVLPGAF